MGDQTDALKVLRDLVLVEHYAPAARELGNLCRGEDQGMARLYYEFAASKGDTAAIEAAVRTVAFFG